MQFKLEITGDTATDMTFLAALSLLLSGAKNQTPTENSSEVPKEKTVKQPKKVEAPTVAAVVDAEQTTSAKEPEKSTKSLEEVRAKAVDLSRAGKRVQVKEILSSLGAEKVTDLDASQYDTFFAELTKL